ncbi:GDSL-type esterase/lipase family protein, partial [Leclercia adecarboxylata]|uniref:GDSL-type esterase/lipase family protein n=1 Tax=Leclercia adecarboxylata TaxID=83655 RepID=UPI00234E0606
SGEPPGPQPKPAWAESDGARGEGGDYPWQPGVQPAGKVTALNRAWRAYAEQQGLVYLGYHTAMTNKDGGLDPDLATDGVHPTPAGYARMVPLADAAVTKALAR